MKHLLLFFAVLAPFVPDIALAGSTGSLGQITAADRLILPAFITVALFARRLPATPMERYARPLLVFVLIALVSSVSVPLRFPTAEPNVAVMGVLRMAKFSGYALLALASLRCFASPTYRKTVVAAWAVGVVLMSGVLVYQAVMLDQGLRNSTVTDLLFGNPTSVALACIVVSSLSVLLAGSLSRRENWVLSAVSMAAVIGMVFSQGRGGWISLLLGAAFMLRRIRLRFVFAAATVALIVVTAAANSASVSTNLKRLITEEQGYSASGEDAEASLDDGARFASWLHESAKLAEHPLLGFGIFHRGGASPLWPTGSHNFFLQMFLESGLFGGGAFVWFFWTLWRATQALQGQARIGTRAVLLTMVSGAMGGEYLYGDAPLYCFLIALWMLALPAELGGPTVATAQRAASWRRSTDQTRRSASPKSERSGMPASARASKPPSPRSTMQSAPST
jgi:O-antigen ligase